MGDFQTDQHQRLTGSRGEHNDGISTTKGRHLHPLLSQIHKYTADPEKSFLLWVEKICCKGRIRLTAYTVQSTGVSRDVSLILLCKFIEMKQGPAFSTDGKMGGKTSLRGFLNGGLLKKLPAWGDVHNQCYTRFCTEPIITEHLDFMWSAKHTA